MAGGFFTDPTTGEFVAHFSYPDPVDPTLTRRATEWFATAAEARQFAHHGYRRARITDTLTGAAPVTVDRYAARARLAQMFAGCETAGCIDHTASVAAIADAVENHSQHLPDLSEHTTMLGIEIEIVP